MKLEFKHVTKRYSEVAAVLWNRASTDCSESMAQGKQH